MPGVEEKWKELVNKASLKEVPSSWLSGPGSHHYLVIDIRARREVTAQKANGNSMGGPKGGYFKERP